MERASGVLTGNRLFERHPDNPLLRAAGLPYPATSIFNPAAALVEGE